MRELYPSRFPEEIDFSINDMDLVSLLWLGQQNRGSQLPRNLLIANAVAACQISQDMMDQAIELAYRMEQDKDLPSEAVLIVRSQAVIRTLLFDETHNNPCQLNEATMKKVIANFVAQESRDDAVAAIEKAVGEKTKELQAQHEVEIDRVKHELDRAYADQRRQAANMRDDAEREAQKIATCAEKGIKVVVFMLWLACLVWSAYCWWQGGFVYTNVAAIVLSLLSLLQIIDYLFKVLNLKDRLSGLVKDKVFAAAYARGIKKREKITHIPLSL